jgi:hypothetical protein
MVFQVALLLSVNEELKQRGKNTRMARSINPIKVYLESGKKRIFAGALDWPGWCRSGRDEASALQALIDYGPRYARSIHATGLDFREPSNVSDLFVIEQLQGGAGTDFGAPEAVPSFDRTPVDEDDLERLQRLLKACWKALDEAASAAVGKELRKGPRGGGRELEGIIRHVLDAEAGYLSRLGWKLKSGEADDLDTKLIRTRQAVLEALASAVHDGVPAQGPRGGIRWTPRYFVRRDAWHILDHAWEIEDRLLF